MYENTKLKLDELIKDYQVKFVLGKDKLNWNIIKNVNVDQGW